MNRQPIDQKSANAPAHRINHQIRVPQIRVIGPEGAQLGIMSPKEALTIAQDAGLDLVEVAPQARPPVCRILDYGKFRYEQAKKASSSKASRVAIKELRLRPKTDTHDVETKIKQATGFLIKGDRVKFVMRMRGREIAHRDLWIEKMNDLIVALREICNVVASPRSDGRMITAMLEPNRDYIQANLAALTNKAASAPPVDDDEDDDDDDGDTDTDGDGDDGAADSGEA
jgi:translation initiation factor IF-3